MLSPITNLTIRGLDNWSEELLPGNVRQLRCSPEDHPVLSLFSWTLVANRTRAYVEARRQTHRETSLAYLNVRCQVKGFVLYPQMIVAMNVVGIAVETLTTAEQWARAFEHLRRHYTVQWHGKTVSPSTWDYSRETVTVLRTTVTKEMASEVLRELEFPDPNIGVEIVVTEEPDPEPDPEFRLDLTRGGMKEIPLREEDRSTDRTSRDRRLDDIFGGSGQDTQENRPEDQDNISLPDNPADQ